MLGKHIRPGNRSYVGFDEITKKGGGREKLGVPILQTMKPPPVQDSVLKRGGFFMPPGCEARLNKS
jgi:hypothetical protein